MNKQIYIIQNHDNDYAQAVRMTEEQATAINWFIDLADLNYTCCLPEECAVEIEVD